MIPEWDAPTRENLAERLRGHARSRCGNYTFTSVVPQIQEEAAAEIERLKADLAEAVAACRRAPLHVSCLSTNQGACSMCEPARAVVAKHWEAK